ncbi:MAG: hypothetical protein HOE19_00845 [Candidatus Komeilibacteria bacterium]|nr:hypothetical protein [Candidatus Komeilibacteria bacterium]MBT4447611.1 hypothetical protein [Candidatus Komeilibacteria bacterium]
MQIARPQHVIMGAVTTWIVVILSGGSLTATILSPLAIGLQILGASLYYFAVANRMYLLKSDSYTISELSRIVMRNVGLTAMLLAVVMVIGWLDELCILITAFNVLVVVGYKNTISKWWPSKNFLMALVCTTPVLLGWWSGESTHPAVSGGTAAVFFAYLTREIIKDIQDLDVDRGLRMTLPLDRGVGVARVLAGTSMMVSLYFLSRILADVMVVHQYLLAFVLVTVFFFGRVTLGLLFAKAIDAKALSKYILLGNAGLIIIFGLLAI